ncbi:hypothetical protein PVK06_048893 [Gossypium arboreum]|uniref:Uncharacterized protein n=1 Tax=Gossypium arboreum TaxID=29729 RepID=A0ABR0MHI1_GOSAR|nr:hypothetical protein PVK06_048893 [Gossypium arboreum]
MENIEVLVVAVVVVVDIVGDVVEDVLVTVIMVVITMVLLTTRKGIKTKDKKDVIKIILQRLLRIYTTDVI